MRPTWGPLGSTPAAHSAVSDVSQSSKHNSAPFLHFLRYFFPTACLSFLVLIIFAVNVSATSMAEDLIESLAGAVEVRNQSSVMQVGYYLVIPYTVLSLSAVALIFLYDHAAYTHRREQQRPTEDAPKEIMMY